MLYVLAPVLVRVLLDGSGHDSAEIDGTVERHASSTPTKQPAPAPRHSTTKESSDVSNLSLELNKISKAELNARSKLTDMERSLEAHPRRDRHSGPREELGQETASSTSKQPSYSKPQESWRSMSGSGGEACVPAELWESQFSTDVSPGSCNEEAFAKNGSRQGTISDTDSDGCSPQRSRRRSPSKRRTL